jgi:hypothetical protein
MSRDTNWDAIITGNLISGSVIRDWANQYQQNLCISESNFFTVPSNLLCDNSGKTKCSYCSSMNLIQNLSCHGCGAPLG